ncbi:hypothetical protein ON006_05095 [Dyadobacter pollutisoli]|uniref:HAD family hydrolase n=2 Tax=Dyadobacter pollutisoli TaxID=2910158 RepID=A0A9E8SMH7_9BACT|nr:hypothetical protein [Dyadobacter pollutisoli]WAC13334.1 hypothetical protein ON006_05095 [Dyadobacter pollutisoli]
MVYEYPLSGTPPMMTHIFENASGVRMVAAKGAPEAMLSVCMLSNVEKESILKPVNEFTKKGYRVLGVGQSSFSANQFPETQQQIEFRFVGLIAFYDPAKHNIRSVLESFYRAGIQIKIITGDNAATT